MTTKALTSRFIKLFVFISTIVLIITSCKIGEEDTTTITGEDGYNLIGTQVIGSTGGEINLDSIIVKVPSNAFGENTELSIYVGVENDGFDEYGNSALYQIGGLPSTINKPIRLSIKYHGTLEGDTLVAIGEMGYAVSLDSSLYSYHTENASDSAGYLVYDLPANLGLAKLAQPESIFLGNAINLIGLNRYIKVPSSNGHFMLSYPLLNNPQGVLMGEHFETAYTTCLAMGFDLSARSWSTQPANVLAKTLRIGLNGCYTKYGKATMTDEILKSLIKKGKFTINLNLFTDDLKLRTVCGHEFLHLVQNLYEFSAPWIEPEQSWLKEATSVWIMEKYSTLPYYVPHTLNNREYYLFDGWQYTSTSRSHARHGYGLSPIIKEIADTYSDDAIIEIFEKIKAGTLPTNAVDPVEAVLSVVDKYEPIDYFWYRVLRDYVLGKYYNNQVNFKFLDHYTYIFRIDEQNSSHSLKYNYHDLSGKLFKVLPGDLSSLDKIPLSLTVDDPTNCGILVCEYSEGLYINILGEVYPGGSGQVSLSDVKPVFDNYNELVVMVSNSTHDKNSNYQGENEVELLIELNQTDKQIKYLTFDFVLDEAETKRTLSTGAVSYSKRISHDLSSVCGTSYFSDNVYTTIFDKDECQSLTGQMTVTFLENPRRVNVHAEWSRTLTDCITNYVVDYEGLPYAEKQPGPATDLYHESGSTVSKINISRYEVTCTPTNSPHSTKELLNTNCGNDAEISVYVYYE